MSVLRSEEQIINRPAQDGGTAPACPLCGEKKPAIVASVTPRQLQEAWRVLGVTVSREALGELAEMDSVKLWRCANCGFEYSHLNLAGGALFYEELQRQLPNYYPIDSPEYVRGIRFAHEHHLTEVLDVGCGAGAFLDLAKKGGLRTHGVELNPKGAAIARQNGHSVYNDLLRSIIAGGEHPRFEFVTTWQVLEHVSDPVSFLWECAQFVKPGGYLAVAVPAEDGINSLSPYNPHVWPPHHVTRWRLTHLRQLGTKIGLQFVTGGNDPMNPHNARYMWGLHNQLAGVYGYKPYAGGKLLPKLLALASAGSGLHKLLPEWGHSTYAFFRRPEGASTDFGRAPF
jgi:SAM-dependent methyltransferase